MRRRHFLGFVLAGALAAPETTAAAAKPLNLIEVEQLAVYVVEAVLAGGTLGAQATAVARRILEHEQAHVRLLGAAERRQGRPIPPPPATTAEADRRLSELNASGRLATVHTEADALRLLYDVVSLAIGHCWKALHTIGDPPLIRLVTSIMGCEAQHASALGGLLHPGKWDRVVPVGSVEGKH